MARGWLVYTLDDGTNTSMKATTITATYNGQTLQKFPPVGSVFGYNYRDRRHICGVTSDGLHRARMTVCDPDVFAAIVIGTDNWTDSLGRSYTCTSKIGERLDSRDAG